MTHIGTRRRSGIWSHPDDGLLQAYRAARLDPGQDLAVQAHIEVCRTCREATFGPDVSQADTASSPAVAVSDHVFPRLLQRIERDEALLERPANAWLRKVDLPGTIDLPAIGKRRWPAPGVWIAPLHLSDTEPSSRTYLIGARRHTEVPDHTHKGQEITVVLSGHVTDQGQVYGPGDLIVAGEEHVHRPMALEDCVCLVAAHAPVVMKGLVGRLVQAIAGI